MRWYARVRPGRSEDLATRLNALTCPTARFGTDELILRLSGHPSVHAPNVLWRQTAKASRLPKSSVHPQRTALSRRAVPTRPVPRLLGGPMFVRLSKRFERLTPTLALTRCRNDLFQVGRSPAHANWSVARSPWIKAPVIRWNASPRSWTQCSALKETTRSNSWQYRIVRTSLTSESTFGQLAASGQRRSCSLRYRFRAPVPEARHVQQVAS